MITIKQITSNLNDIRLPNESFKIWGKMIPSLQDGKWDYKIQEFQQVETMRFPNEAYTFDKGKIYLGAYNEQEKCVGLALLEKNSFNYLYLADLKVNNAYRNKGIGKKLISACLKAAKQNKFSGVHTIGQDNNLSACLFYLKAGFEIGGFDNHIYNGSSQAGKADIHFYQNC